ncbi:MAG: glycosyltransferase family 2 protein [Clostridia bacterium]|nr:glycosyltransferase family 2 protein [Clostridia bacterium]
MKKVQVLLSTYNGEKYLKEQIESIIKQEEVEISLLVRDDGSTDKTIEILEEISKKNTNIKFYKGENKGPARSFMELVQKSEEADYYAFADQDDVWETKKIISAVKKLNNSDIPELYVSSVTIVDENLNNLEKKEIQGKFTFEGEMIKNFAYGCTQVFSKKLRDIINLYEPQYIIMHDSWITRVCYAIGGNVIIDKNSYIKYRQHSNNVVGYKDYGIKKLKKQFNIAFKEKTKMRVNIAMELKSGYKDLLTQKSLETIENLIEYTRNTKAKKWLLFNKEFRTNSFIINTKMIIAILLNKF